MLAAERHLTVLAFLTPSPIPAFAGDRCDAAAVCGRHRVRPWRAARGDRSARRRRTRARGGSRGAMVSRTPSFAVRRQWLRRQVMIARVLVYFYLVCFGLSLLLDQMMVPLAIAP